MDLSHRTVITLGATSPDGPFTRPGIEVYRGLPGATRPTLSEEGKMAKSLVLCDCLGSQSLDKSALEQATGLSCSRIHTALCRAEADQAAEILAAASEAGEVLIACGQEQATFDELAADLDAPAPDYVDLRDRAGWSDDLDTTPKMAALAVDALHPLLPSKTMDVVSDGICLVLGSADVTLPAAEQLAEHLSVTVLLDPGSDLPDPTGFDVIFGRLRAARGAFGQFDVRIDAFQEPTPGGRGRSLSAPQDGARSTCDVILDLRRDPPLFPAHEKRDGYLRADPGRPAAVAKAVLQASHLTGTFEKTLHVALAEPLCAHSRAGKPACSKCLDACPTGAITSAGEFVAIDPHICAGCGACSALCPTGAITAEDPAPQALFARLHRLAEAFGAAGGKAPRLLVHGPHGAEMIRLAARHGRGLPADVIPLELASVTGFGHAEILAARASGFTAVDILLPPQADRDTAAREIALAQALGADPVRLLETEDPDTLSATLYSATKADPQPPILALGTRRQATRLAAKALNQATDTLPLPQGSPYGTVEVDTEACTLCLACASLCPAGALGDNPELPQLRFQEDACVQCGLCTNVCPESAITLAPRLDLTDAALSQRVLYEEEPFACISCGKLFGSKSTIERITAKLAEHSMFAGTDKAKLIQMCDDCRIQAQYHSENNPFTGPDRPQVRTTEDYLSKRRDH